MKMLAQTLLVSLSLVAVTACLFAKQKPIKAVQPPLQEFAEVMPLVHEATALFTRRHPHKLEVRAEFTYGTDWAMTRHRISGDIIGRLTGTGFIVFDHDNQKCWQWRCDMHQENNGQGWGRPYLDCPTTLEVFCDSIDELEL